MKHYFLTLLIITLPILSIAGYSNTIDTTHQVKREVVLFDVSYKGDIMGNICGGIKRSGTYLGYAQIGLGIDFEALNWWKGGMLYIKGGNTHGGTPSETFIGDSQIASNIEAGNHTFLQELWFSQSFKNVEIKIGMQDYNADYAVCEPSGMFLNSALGIHSSLSGNLKLPIFPIMGWACNINWDIRDDMSWRVGVFDSPLDFEENPYNLHWKINSEKGVVLTTEYNYKTNINNNLEGRYCIGFTYQTALRKWGVHLNAAQAVWKQNQHQLSLFAMYAICKGDERNYHNHLGAGITMEGVFSKHGRDALGLAFTTEFLESTHLYETTIELTYQYHIHENIFLQPDIQYVINPSGTGMPLKNALVMALRVGIDF